jgi:hypothetical protein
MLGVAPACGGDGDGEALNASCVPRSQQACIGPNSCSGVQQCEESGVKYTTCVCGTAGSGGSSTAGTGGSTNSGGSSLGGTTSSGGSPSGGTGNDGGTTNVAGSSAGGTTSNGGSTNSGGAAAGGTTSNGGNTSSGGAAAGGTTSNGGSTNSGGAAAGGTTSNGGNTSSGGAAAGGTTSNGGNTNTAGSSAGGTSGGDVCGVGTGTSGLIDNFDDHNLKSLGNDGRTSEEWQAYNDAVIALHSGGSYLSCALTSVSQACGVNFHHDCYDASVYNGIKVIVRGKGKIVLALKTPATTPISEGGRCKPTTDSEGKPLPCGDNFRVMLPELSATEWTTLILDWSKFEQGKWGVPAPEGLKTEELMSVVLGPDFWPKTTGDAKVEIKRIEFY